MKTETIIIPADSAGLSLSLTVHRFGQPGGRPSVYIQAGLHADEIPGMICAVELRRMLEACEADGVLTGEVILVPVANPIGLAQDVLNNPIGRFNLVDGGNFNRNFPDLGVDLADDLRPVLGSDVTANIRLVRAELARRLAHMPAITADEALKKTLVGLALPCDLVLDLHCDAEATMHLYTHTASAQTFAPLAARLGCRAVLLAENSGGDPFDEALSRPWHELAQKLPEFPIPFACQSTTVELRGQSDVSAEMAVVDANAILNFLRDVGVLADEAPPPPAAHCVPTPLAASLPLVAPVSGILVYRRQTGITVSQGDVVAHIVDPITGIATEIPSPCDGMFFARSALRYVRPGKRLGKVAGQVVARSGPLLSP